MMIFKTIKIVRIFFYILLCCLSIQLVTLAGGKNKNEEQGVILREKGFKAFEENNYEEAINYYQKALKTNPKQEGVYLPLSLAYLNREEYDNFVESFEKSINNDYRFLNSHFILGVFNTMSGVNRFGKAKKFFENQINTNPEEKKLYYKLGVILFVEGGSNLESTKNIEKAIDLGFIQPEAFYLLCISYLYQNKIDLFIKNYNLLQKYNPRLSIKLKQDIEEWGLKNILEKAYKIDFETLIPRRNN